MLLRPRTCVRAAASSLCFWSRPLLPTMPLRAKITNPALVQQTMAKSTAARAKERQKSNSVLFGSNYGVRTIELNRPEALNALNGEMVDEITPRLQEWEKSQLANVIVIKGVGRAFCAGGDVKALALQNQKGSMGQGNSAKYFENEYRLDHLIATYSKPYVAFLDGITMGGGVGLSVHAPFRIATEQTLFAMPETTIGFFPDVGGSFFLPRLDGLLGTYLALTSERLQGVHAFYAGVATHYIHSSSLPDLEDRLAELVFADGATLESRNEIVNSTIEEFATGVPDEPFTLSGEIREAIDRCFSPDSVKDILEALEKEDTEWARGVIKTLRERSPTSVHVTLLQLRLGKSWTISQTFQRESNIAAQFMRHPDFVEGVLKQLAKPRQKPTWDPPTIEEVKSDGVEAFFRYQGEPMELLKNQGDYRMYPHAKFGLPSEEKIKRIIDEGMATQKSVVQHLIDEYNGKQGVKQKVNEVVLRKTERNESSGFLKWKTGQGEWFI